MLAVSLFSISLSPVIYTPPIEVTSSHLQSPAVGITINPGSLFNHIRNENFYQSQQENVLRIGGKKKRGGIAHNRRLGRVQW